MSKQIEALKLALECIEAWGRGCDRDHYWRDIEAATNAIREALAEPAQQQKPVARVINKSIVWRPCDIAGLPVGTPLYTSPPASKPLTDEQQIAEALRRHGLTLVKTATGYDVLKLGPITAHGIKRDA